jgi:hypothetical protein
MRRRKRKLREALGQARAQQAAEMRLYLAWSREARAGGRRHVRAAR